MTVKLVKDTMTASLARIAKDLAKVPEEAYKFWVSVTPKKTGNARRNTKLSGKEIRADYNYAVPLDKGRSRQAPQGMSKPTEKFIERSVRSKIRK